MVTTVIRFWLLVLALPLLWGWLGGGDNTDDSDDAASADDETDAGAIIAGQGEELAEEWEDNLPDWMQDDDAATDEEA